MGYSLRLLIFFVASLTLAAGAAAQDKLLTIDEIYDPARRVDFGGSPPTNLVWLREGDYYLHGETGRQPDEARIFKVNARTGERTPFFDQDRMAAALARLSGVSAADAGKLSRRASYHLNPAQTAALINHGDDLLYYDFASGTARQLTSGPGPVTDAEFSPDGRMVSFVRGNNLYVVPIAGGGERALTRDGGPRVLNGRLDWVYEEELYGRGTTGGHWWSPDSTRIAFLRLDETPVHNFAVVDHIPRRQIVEDTPYPLAGDPNPLVRLGIVDVTAGNNSGTDSSSNSSSARFVDTGKYRPEDLLIVRVTWSPDGRRVIYQAQNREQTFLDLNSADPESGATQTLFRETTRAWVEVIDNPVWLRDNSFLWRSERSGWMHLYHYSPAGELLRQVTSGPWEVRSINGVDERSGLIYFNTTAHSHIAEHVYRVRLDGTGLTRLTTREGAHRAVFNPAATLFIDYWSDAVTPTQVHLLKADDGATLRTIDENRADALKQYRLGAVEFLRVMTRDGFPMEAMMIKPPDFDSRRKYPVMSFTYAGPHAPAVRNRWGDSTYLWHQLLAQKGYIIWICDNRTASGKGAESVWPLYRNFGELELRDLEDGISYLKKQPFVDGARIGLWGWSYGGYMTSYALTHSRSFRLGIAGGSVTHWLNYDSIYTERYMQTPQHNPDGYRKSAPLEAAGNLHGKLLLIHGALDDNVHLQNTLQFAYELQKAGKPFQLMIYPKSRHGVTDPLLLKHMRALMTDFIVENL